MDFACFSSSDPAAKNATLVFDFNADEGALWSSQGGPLPLCSSSPPPDSRCLVCLRNDGVFAVCRNVTDGVKVTMEAAAEQVKLSESGCPELLSGDAPQWKLLVTITITITITITLIIIGVFLYKYWKRSTNPEEQRGMEMQTREEDESDVMMKD